MDWTANRMLAKTNYRIHTDSIKQNIVPKITENQKKYIYAEEADVLNVALLGMTAKEWKKINPGVFTNNLGAYECYEADGFKVTSIIKDAFLFHNEKWDCAEMVLNEQL